MEGYVGKQFVGIVPHRRRSVIVRTTESGEVLEATQILNDVDRQILLVPELGAGDDRLA